VLRTGLMTMAVVMALGVAAAGVAAGQTLSHGDRGTAVEQLQRKLGVTADGIYGPQTRAAVRRFQRREGLTVDGVAGPETLRALGIDAPRDRASRTRIPAALERIAECESGGDPRAIGGGGKFRGKYQFTYETWRAVGGTGDPAAAPESEQDRRAAILYRREGSAPWPNCG
jgi:resuscitation-promoting factor RpfB